MEDVSTDLLLLRADGLAFKYTWMDAAASVNMSNFQLFHQSLWERHVNIVTVYMRNDYAYTSISPRINLAVSQQLKLSAMSSYVEDIKVTHINWSDRSKF